MRERICIQRKDGLSVDAGRTVILSPLASQVEFEAQNCKFPEAAPDVQVHQRAAYPKLKRENPLRTPPLEET